MGVMAEQHGILPAVHAQPADVAPSSRSGAGRRRRQTQQGARILPAICTGAAVGASQLRASQLRASQLRASCAAVAALQAAVSRVRVWTLGSGRLSAGLELLAPAAGGCRGGPVLGASAALLLHLLLLGAVEGDDGDLDVALSRIPLEGWHRFRHTLAAILPSGQLESPLTCPSSSGRAAVCGSRLVAMMILTDWRSSRPEEAGPGPESSARTSSRSSELHVCSACSTCGTKQRDRRRSDQA